MAADNGCAAFSRSRGNTEAGSLLRCRSTSPRRAYLHPLLSTEVLKNTESVSGSLIPSGMYKNELAD